MSDTKDPKVSRVVHEARAVLATRFGLEFLAKQYELAAAAEEAEKAEGEALARDIADELRRPKKKKFSILSFKRGGKRFFSKNS